MQNCIYQAWFCDFTSPVQAPGSPTYGVILIWGFFYDKDMFLGFKFIKYLKKLQSESIFKLDFSEKNRKFCRTFRVQVMSGTVCQEKVESGTSGPQIVVQACHGY